MKITELIIKIKPNPLFEIAILLIGIVIGFILGLAFAR